MPSVWVHSANTCITCGIGVGGEEKVIISKMQNKYALIQVKKVGSCLICL